MLEVNYNSRARVCVYEAHDRVFSPLPPGAGILGSGTGTGTISLPAAALVGASRRREEGGEWPTSSSSTTRLTYAVQGRPGAGFCGVDARDRTRILRSSGASLFTCAGYLGIVSVLPNPRNPVLWAAAWHVKPAAQPPVMVYMSNFTAFRCGQGSYVYCTIIRF